MTQSSYFREGRNAEFVRLHREGMGPCAISVRYGVHRHTVAAALKAAGITKGREVLYPGSQESQIWDKEPNDKRRAFWERARVGARASLAAGEGG